ncbi:MAG: TrkH family potassium uptake protein [Paracoccaceae bacterium]|nr:MAG: TrkH family potassium uptake protein [Paracoccaceae bacterium]
MLVPAVYGHLHDDHRVARTFLYAGVTIFLLTAMVGVAMAGQRPRNVPRRHLAMLAGAYLLLPLLYAVPFDQAVRDTSFVNAWFEMVSCFTTTGATVYETPGRLSPTLHLWRGLVGWFGGLFVLISVSAILAPMDLGGIEVASGRVPGQGGAARDAPTRLTDPSARLVRQTLVIAPAYAALTLLLWVGLLTAGESALPALMMAMATVSTSGIVAGAGNGLHQSPVGFAGEAMVFLVLLTALTRRSLPGAVRIDLSPGPMSDPEIRLAAAFLVTVPTVLFLRHWAGAWDGDTVNDLGAGARALWGALFTTLSFLTTTGLESADWQAARSWSGLGAPGLILLGLAMIGGGVATTAGGLKLLRVYALIRHGEREMDRLVHPSSVGGGGETARRLRNQGAYAAWIFFMLFALTLTVGVGALALARLPFEPALVLTIAALTTTGPLANLAAETPISIIELSTTAKAILGVLMVLGRVEVLAILALLAPSGWRR